MTTWYLDNEDEITDAVARLRKADSGPVVFVVPPGSRIATGRINFKLLAREAASRDLAMAVASPDEQVRALATSAGVLAASTPDEAEAALERGDEVPQPTAPADDAAAVVSAGVEAAPEPGALSWRSQRLRFVTVAVLVLAVVAGYVVTQVLPTAEITLTPRLAAVGPIQVEVTASTGTDELDAEAGLIPASSLSIPLSAGDEYPASGTSTVETLATGEVVFSSTEQEFDQEIAAATRVTTPAGVGFQTTETVTLPRADGTTATIVAPIEALQPGSEGNVPAEAISIVPSLESQGISVSNPEATRGGRFEERSVVTAADYDAAAVDLRNRLTGALAAHLRDPANAPEGQSVFTETAKPGQLTLEPPADEVVGSTSESFRLTGAIEAEVLTVDESLVDEITRLRLAEQVPAAARLLSESVSITHGEGTVDGALIRFEGLASGTIVPVVEVDALLDRIAGLPISDARAILEELGPTTVNVWPGFIGDLPDDRQRILLDVEEASTTE